MVTTIRLLYENVPLPLQNCLLQKVNKCVNENNIAHNENTVNGVAKTYCKMTDCKHNNMWSCNISTHEKYRR